MKKIPTIPPRNKKFDVLIISDDVVGERMAGPGIRAWELARVLARRFKVALARPDYSPAPLPHAAPGFAVFSYTVGKEPELLELVLSSEIILLEGYILNKFPALKRVPSWLIVDMYVPFVLENLFIHQRKIPRIEERQFVHRRDLQVFNELLLHGHHFLCATEKQKDLLTGCLLSLNRVNPEILDSSPDLSNLISVVPFGLSEEEEAEGVRAEKQAKLRAGEGQEQDILAEEEERQKKTEEKGKGEEDQEQEKEKEREKVRGNLFPIAPEDTLFLWGGVISNWFDPLTLLLAFDKAVKKNPRIKLLFLSATHPNPLLPKLDMAQEAMRLAASLGIKGSHVFFNQDWIEYGRRARYFREADVGVSIHKVHFETRFSFRTRMLDYLKYELPILCTEGDFFADLVRQKNLGVVVPEGNQEALSEAILYLALSPGRLTEMRHHLREVKKDFTWGKVSQPLVSFCEKVLRGEIKKPLAFASRSDLLWLFQPRKESLLRRVSRHRFLWKLLQKTPPSVAIPLKKLLK